MQINFLELCSIPNIDILSGWSSKNQPFRIHSLRKSNYKEPPWHIASIELSTCPIGSIAPTMSQSVAGSSIFAEEALTACIGEAIERYCGSNYHLIDTPKFRSVDEELNFVRCADWENSPSSFKERGVSEPIAHTETICLTTGNTVYLPYETVYLTFQKNDLKTLFASPISSGLSFYTNLDIAILKGILEVIERDAIMKWWHSDFPFINTVDVNTTYSFGISERVRRIREAGLDFYLFNISEFDEVPVILSLIHSNEYPYACFGASCNLNIERAISKSLDEAIAIRAMAKWQRKKESIDVNSFQWINELSDHMHLYANWKNSDVINRLITSSKKSLTTSDIKYNKLLSLSSREQLDWLTRFLESKGYQVFYKNLTLPEISPIGFVVKVVIPKMIPLSQSYNIRWLSTLSQKMSKNRINNYPHPFA